MIFIGESNPDLGDSTPADEGSLENESLDRNGLRKGNPLGLTVNQHVLPAKSIERFTNASGCVELNWYGQRRPMRFATPKDEAFVVKRAWMHGAEYHQTVIETQFQKIADRILSTGRTLVCENVAISEFFALWRARMHYRHSPLPDTPLRHVKPGTPITASRREALEKNGYLFASERIEGGSRIAFFEGRQLTGVQIRMRMDQELLNLQFTDWRLVTALEGEFVVPDTFGDYLAIPLSPKALLVNGWEGPVTLEWVCSTNMLAVCNSRDYWFARSMKDVGFSRAANASLRLAGRPARIRPQTFW